MDLNMNAFYHLLMFLGPESVNRDYLFITVQSGILVYVNTIIQLNGNTRILNLKHDFILLSTLNTVLLL